MNRKQLLDQAAKIVEGKREDEYGTPEDSFKLIGHFWSTYLGMAINPTDVAIMMALLKIARLKGDRAHQDSWVDLAGYAACGSEIACKDKVEN